MREFLRYILILLFFFCFTIFPVNSNEDLKKIDQQLKSIEDLYKSGVFDEVSYNKAKDELLDRRIQIKQTLNKKKADKNPDSKTLEKQLEVIKKLLNEGVLSEEEYEKTKSFLEKKQREGTNIDLKDLSSDKENIIASFQLNVKKSPGRKTWEPAELIYKNYKIYTYRPGGIRVVRISDNKKLVQIVDNYKIKYYNGGEDIVKIEKTVYQRDKSLDPTKQVEKTLGDIEKLLKNPTEFLNPKKKKPVFNTDTHKLKLFIDDVKIITYEGRYVKKHKAFFYQVLTSRNQPFHFYIKIDAKKAIALNMEFFNAKIDRAIRKVKKELATEFNVSEAEIQRIIDQQIGEATERSVEQAMEQAINDSVVEAIEQSVGEVLSAQLVNAIEQATGEAIDASIEAELADAINAEIAYAVSIGIDEAAVTAGWEAYFEVLAQGGTVEDASAAAYEACGSACDNY